MIKYKKLGYLRSEIMMRFVYFTSDLPLRTESNLSQAMRIDEGVPPLYGITRAMLQQILAHQQQQQQPTKQQQQQEEEHTHHP